MIYEKAEQRALKIVETNIQEQDKEIDALIPRLKPMRFLAFVVMDTLITFLIFAGTFLFWWTLAFYKKRSQMGGTWEGLVSATIIIKDKELKCSHCEHTQFSKVEGLLNTTWVSFFNFSFLNKSSSCFCMSQLRFYPLVF